MSKTQQIIIAVYSLLFVAYVFAAAILVLFGKAAIAIACVAVGYGFRGLVK